MMCIEVQRFDTYDSFVTMASFILAFALLAVVYRLSQAKLTYHPCCWVSVHVTQWRLLPSIVL